MNILNKLRATVAVLITYNGQYDAALADYGRAISRQKNKFEQILARGQLYFKLKRFDKACEDYSRIITANPLDDDVLLKRAECYVQMKQPQKALIDLNEAIAGAPEFGGAIYLTRAKVFDSLGKKSLADQDRAKAAQLSKRPAIHKI